METRKMQAEYPKNTWELLKYIAKKIPERLLKALPMTIAIGAAGWLLHTFLLVYVNEGFNPGTWLGNNLLNVKGRFLSSTFLWTMVGAVIPMLIGFLKRGGNPVSALASIVKMPGNIVAKSKTAGKHFLPFLCFACAVSLMIEWFFTGVTSAVLGGILMSSVVAFVTGRGSIFIQMIRMIFSDVQTYILKKQKFRLDNDSIYMILGTSGTALLVFGVLKALRLPWIFTWLINYLWVAFIILGVVLLVNKGKAPKQFVFVLGLIGASLFLSQVLHLQIFADDGGWQEAGGTLGGWLTSAGAFPAAFSGLPPAIGGLIGSYVSTILGGLFDGFGDIFTTVPVVPTGVPDTSEPPVVINTTSTTPQIPQTPADTKQAEEERIRQEQERIRLEEEQRKAQEEFERRRQIELQKQLDIRNKALEEKKRLEKQYADHQAYVASLCAKYDTTPDKLRDVLISNMNANEAEAKRYEERAKNLDYALKAAQITLVAADTAIDGLANITGPVGKQWRAGYKVVKGLATGMSEAYADNKSMWAGAGSGLVKGGADAASDYIDSTKVKIGLTVGSEAIGGAITDGTDGFVKGLKNGAYNAGVNVLTDKLGGGGYGNDVSLVTQAGGKSTAVIISAGKQTFTRIVSTNTAQNFIKDKLVNQGIQSAVKGTSGLLNEMVVKPALTKYKVLPE